MPLTLSMSPSKKEKLLTYSQIPKTFSIFVKFLAIYNNTILLNYISKFIMTFIC
jgi:hypothetical protein